MNKSPLRPRVVELVRLGVPGATIGRTLGISRERVRQIWFSETLTPMPKQPRLQPIDHRTRTVRRFWTRVRVDDSGCWTWTGCRYPTGYGSHKSGTKQSGYAHRYAYETVVGPIPDGLEIDHVCGNRACVNPAHLEAVTHRVNTLRSPIAVAAINARKTHCKRGHEFTPENTLRQAYAPDRRRCRICNSAAQRKYYARRKQAVA